MGREEGPVGRGFCSVNGLAIPPALVCQHHPWVGVRPLARQAGSYRGGIGPLGRIPGSPTSGLHQ